ncbi:MAG: class I SAM-dependent methyltransferase [Schleiferiaceae bacterium]|nr:class I SAM-dependent methyltransferase [Schleiferiaceae bacterium]
MRNLDIFRCPQCHENEFKISSDLLECEKCRQEFVIVGEQVVFNTHLGDVFEQDPIVNSKSDPLRHWKTGNLMSLLPEDAEQSILLNLGAGDGSDSEFLRSKNFEVVSTDLEYNENLDVVADAQNLPFNDNTFDYLVMLSVLEHVTNPQKLFSEISRVLKPGGKLIASSAFLEPYHAYSRFHISALGILQLLKDNNLRAENLSPGWDVFSALGMALFPFLRPFRPFFSVSFNLIISLRIFLMVYLKGKSKVVELEGLEISLKTYERLRFSGSVIYSAVK